MVQMLKLQIPKSRMNYLIKQVQLHYDAVILEEGWEYYHKAKVHNLHLVGGTVKASVQGTKPFNVVIDLEDFSSSKCTCADDGYCKHMAAVFFSLYVPFGRPELLLQQLRQSILTRKKTGKSSGLAQEKKPAIAYAPTAEMMPQEWHRFFEGKFHGFSISHQNSIESFYETALATMPVYAEGWRTSLKQVYGLHIVLFIMRKIEQFYQDTKSSYLSYYHENGCKVASEQCIDKFQEVIKVMNLDTIFTAESKHWQATLAMLGELALHGKDSPIDWLFVYRYMWWRVTDHPSWKQHEMRRLDLLLNKKELTPRKKDLLLIARAHFDIMQSQMEPAFQRLNEITHRNTGDFFLYLHANASEGSWDQNLIWLRWLTPAIQKANHDDFRTFCQYWMDTAKHLDSDAEWVQIMESLLPRSYYYYTAYLLQTSRYKQWVDLQLANRISPLSLYALELKAIEEEDPALLLPLYHQAAERAVLEKNRASYKTAVRLLKKLHGTYKQLKQEDRWERYINRLADKFSRLRAFQEELKKGKWIR
ncbi:hypothetical protein D3C73_478070 [compost metagenome]